MSDYSSKELLISVLRFFCMDAEAQLSYANNLPQDLSQRYYAFGLDHSPLLELAEATENIARVLTDGEESHPAFQSLEEFHALLQLIVCCQHLADYGTGRSLRNDIEWRLARKLGRLCLRDLGIPEATPAIPYEELVPYVMD